MNLNLNLKLESETVERIVSNSLGLPGGGLIAVGFDSYVRMSGCVEKKIKSVSNMTVAELKQTFKCVALQ